MRLWFWIINFKLISRIYIWSIYREISFRWILQDDLILFQVMVWCLKATAHYLSQSCSRSLSPYNVTKPQIFNRAHIQHTILRNLFWFSYYQHWGAKVMQVPVLQHIQFGGEMMGTGWLMQTPGPYRVPTFSAALNFHDCPCSGQHLLKSCFYPWTAT